MLGKRGRLLIQDLTSGTDALEELRLTLAQNTAGERARRHFSRLIILPILQASIGYAYFKITLKNFILIQLLLHHIFPHSIECQKRTTERL